MEKNLVSNEAKIEEISKNKALVSYAEGNTTKKVVAKAGKNSKVGDTVSLYSASKYPYFARLLLVLMPLIMFLAGFGFGFFFKNDLYHYLLAACLGILGFLILLVITLSTKKFSSKAYFCK